MPGPVTDERAYALRDRYHARFGGHELPVPVGRIAEDLLGLAVDEERLEVSGLLLPASRRIVVNAQEPPARRRFTVAHELGHWICQCLEGTTTPVYCRSEDITTNASRTLDREANVFAAELLMPDPAVREAWSRRKAPDELAEAFGVSAEAMRWRLYNLTLSAEKPSPIEPTAVGGPLG